MEPTIGKALREARLKKGLTPQEVAKAIKMRVDWVTDLENEQYHRFPSLGYARNFQILYAKYLGIDIRETVMLDPGKTTLKTTFDHLYDGVIPVGYRGIKRRKPIRRSRWLLAIIVFGIASLVGAITALIILDILRLPSWDEMTGEGAGTEERVVVEPEATPEPLPLPTPEPTPAPTATPVPEPQPIAPPPHTFEIFPPSAALRDLFREVDPLWPPLHRPASEPSAPAPEESDPFEHDAEALATPFPDTPDPEAEPTLSPTQP